MKWFVALLIALTPLAASAKDASISMMYSNAIADTQPFELIRSGSWSAEPDARFVKLHMYFDWGIEISAVEIDACEPPPRPQFSLWLNFDESRFTLDAEDAPGPSDIGVDGRTLYARGFERGTVARSLTWNFEGWRGVKLCGLRVFDETGAPYTLQVPAVVAATARASSTLVPTAAYDVLHLFDSRFEYAWASAGKATGVDLVFRFDQPQKIEKLRIWNGYQRSGVHCIANSRARRLQITGDGGYAAAVEVADRLGSQVIDLPTPFLGRELRITIAEAYPGKDYKDLVISELRFWNPDGWFTIDALPMLRTASQANRDRFAAADLGGLLGDGYRSETPDEISYRDETVLRLRADGSFYLSGTGSPTSAPKPAPKQTELRRYFALGNFELKHSDARGLRLRLFGLYYETDAYGDCNGCGRDCNREKDTSGARIFEEYVRIKPVGRERGLKFSFRVENESGGKKLPFTSLEFAPEP